MRTSIALTTSSTLLLLLAPARADAGYLYPPFRVGCYCPTPYYSGCGLTYPCCNYYLFPLGYLYDTREEALRLLWRGQDLFRYNRLEDALATFTASLRQKADVSDTYFWRGYVLQELGDLVPATEAYRLALRLGYAHPAETHNNLGAALAATGRWREALAEYRAALKVAPDFAPAKENLEAAGPLARAAERLDAILDGKEKPADAADAARLAEVAYTRGLFAESMDLWKLAFDEGRNKDRLELSARAALRAAESPRENGTRRRLALGWLNEDLARRRTDVTDGVAGAVEDTRQTLRRWQQDAVLGRYLRPSATRNFPPDERDAWKRLGDDVADLMRKADALPAGRWKREGKDHVQQEAAGPPLGQTLHVGDAGWDNYDVEVRTLTTGGELGLVVRAQDPRTRILIVFDGKDNTAHRVLLQSDASPLRVLLQVKKAVIVPDRWQRVRAKVLANTLRVTVDDRELFLVEFRGFERGKVGLWTNGPAARFRDLIVTSRGGAILHEEK